MSLPDAINGSFEAFGAAVLLLNVRQLYIDKRVMGVHWGVTVFFSTWGLWNLFYYWRLDQILSWYAGMAVVTVNVAWLVLLLTYSRKAKGKA